MKNIVVALLLIVATASATFAQNTAPRTAAAQKAPKTIDQQADEITAGMAKNLALTPAQVKKVREINVFGLKGVAEARVLYKGEPRKIAEQVDLISQTRLSKLKDVLSPLQFAKYQQRREEKMGVPQQMQGNPSRQEQNAQYYSN
ncbi:hypothetical protein [Pontibacter harenae]|uniref:hypothetical protein n=1 Tax=Pontibacter harenae TaxID=2894083 RepID=UPI001E2B175D|nr:hypothetical protein [Pontibacter harenae]MCC9166786.1 hypothetical protein [Pontibacter harenae]